MLTESAHEEIGRATERLRRAYAEREEARAAANTAMSRLGDADIAYANAKTDAVDQVLAAAGIERFKG